MQKMPAGFIVKLIEDKPEDIPTGAAPDKSGFLSKHPTDTRVQCIDGKIRRVYRRFVNFISVGEFIVIGNTPTAITANDIPVSALA